MKVNKIEFMINASAGELQYRGYHTTHEVNGCIYVIISKLLANDDVFFKLYEINTASGNPNIMLQQSVPFTQFKDVVAALLTDLQKKDPTVQLIEHNGASTGVAVGTNGKVLSAEALDGVLGSPLEVLKQMANEMAKSGPQVVSPNPASNQNTGTSSRLNKFMQ